MSETTPGLSLTDDRWIYSINTGTDETPSFEKLWGTVDMKLTIDQNRADDSTRDSTWSRGQVTGHSWKVEGKVAVWVDPVTGKLPETLQLLLTKHKLTGAANLVGVEIEDTVLGTVQRGVATVSCQPMDGGAAQDLSRLPLTLEGSGPLVDVEDEPEEPVGP